MLKTSKLATKFTLLLSLVFVSAIVLSGLVLSRALEKRAEGDISYRGQLISEMINSVRYYTGERVAPLLMPLVETQSTFVPEVIPSFSAREVFENLRKNSEYKDYFYKDAFLDPTNLRDKADEFESEIIDRFRNNPNLKSVSNFRDSFGERLFYTARPFVLKNQACLRCHSTPEVAPKSHLASYGSENGFNWKLNEVLGTQIIYVPASQVLENARQASVLFIGIFVAIFAIVILLINYLLKRNVIQPIKPLAQIAQKISADEMTGAEAEEFERKKLAPIAKRNDELGQLGRVFQGMVREIHAREQQLRQQLQKLSLEIDEAKRSRQVAEITESDTFQQLKQEAKELRSKRDATNSNS
ncbi:sensor protein [Leptolyngbya sp. NIES-3755]|nr:sensor protein [Leptolyngbya sp. NIES-3755]